MSIVSTRVVKQACFWSFMLLSSLALGQSTHIVTKPIEPTSWARFPVAKANDLKGGLHTVSNIAARDAIASDFLTIGTLCYVFSNNAFYRYEGGGSWATLELIYHSTRRPSSPRNGALIFNTTDSEYQYYNGTKWVSIGEPDVASQVFKQTGTLIYGGDYKNARFSFGSSNPTKADTLFFFEKENINLIAGRKHEIATSNHSMIWGGGENKITQSDYASILGGKKNQIAHPGQFGAVLGGFTNRILQGTHSTILSGETNDIEQADYSTILAGKGNKIGQNADYSIVGGEGVQTAIGGSAKAQVIFGKFNYNYLNYDPIFAIGWGTGDHVTLRKNILEFTETGHLSIAGKLSLGKSKSFNADNNYYTFPDARGTEGQVLVSDNAGNLSWQDGGGFEDPNNVQLYTDTDYLYTAVGVNYKWYVERMHRTTYVVSKHIGSGVKPTRLTQIRILSY